MSVDSLQIHTDSITGGKMAVLPPPDPASYDLPVDFAQADAEGLTTVIIDSIGRDTISGRIPHFIPVEESDSMKVGSLFDSLSTHTTIPPLPSGQSEGIAPIALPPSYSGSTSLTALLMCTIVLASCNASGIFRALRSYSHELWSVRRRPNVFDEERSVSTPMSVILSLIFIVFGGIILYNLPGAPVSPSFAGAAASMGLLGAYYLFEYIAYQTVGYTFGTKECRSQWINGFMATQSFAGLFFIIPGFLLVYEPQWRYILVIVSLLIYGAAKLIFIGKGFRIFYSNFRSLLYFILYLCTLEIIPALAIYNLSMYLQALTA